MLLCPNSSGPSDLFQCLYCQILKFPIVPERHLVADLYNVIQKLFQHCLYLFSFKTFTTQPVQLMFKLHRGASVTHCGLSLSCLILFISLRIHGRSEVYWRYKQRQQWGCTNCLLQSVCALSQMRQHSPFFHVFEQEMYKFSDFDHGNVRTENTFYRTVKWKN